MCISSKIGRVNKKFRGYISSQLQKLSELLSCQTCHNQEGKVMRFQDVEEVGTHGMKNVVLLSPQPICGVTLKSAGYLRFDCRSSVRENCFVSALNIDHLQSYIYRQDKLMPQRCK